MNTNSNHRPVSIAFALTAAASILTVIGAGTANASIASEPRGKRVASVSATSGSYGEPLCALGGQSLAEYVYNHWAYVIGAHV